MNRLLIALLGIAALAGCGDPAPSTTLAPDVPPVDASKFSATEVEGSKAQEHAGGEVPR